jgi:selenocysteine lyase/cysteine desulfurase
VALTRAELLARAGLAAGALALGEVEDVAAAPADLRDWRDVRAQFALAAGLVQLTSFLLAPHPRPVRAAIERHRRGLDANPVDYLHGNEARLDGAVRTAGGAYLGVDGGSLALTDSTTMGLGLLYRGLRLRSDDVILTTEHDFYSTHEALRLRGGRVTRARLHDDPARASVDEIVSRLRRAVGPRTRVVALTWVHSSTGLKLPLREIREALPERVLLCVDGVHALGVEDASPAALGLDALAAGCHKWLYGPRGTGILWTSPRLREVLRPAIPSFEDGESYGAWLRGGAPLGPPTGARLTPGGFHSFEHRWALADAFRFQRTIGRARVAARVHALASRLKAGLAEVRGVRLLTPRSPALSAGLVCFDVGALDPQEVVARLAARRIVASVTPYARRAVRIGPGIVNTPDEVDRAVREIAAL